MPEALLAELKNRVAHIIRTLDISFLPSKNRHSVPGQSGTASASPGN